MSSTDLCRIAVDMTPVLAGGANGGSKVFVLALLHRLITTQNNIEWVFLTVAANHQELAALDAPNARRVCIANKPVTFNPVKHGMRRLMPPHVFHCLAQIYFFTHRWVVYHLNQRFISLTRLRNAVLYRLESRVSKTFHVDWADLQADLLFCPFTTPFVDPDHLPVVSILHDLQFLYYPQFFDAAEWYQRDRNLRRTLYGADQIICVSHATRQTLLARTGIKPMRVTVIHPHTPPLDRLDVAEERNLLTQLGVINSSYLLYPANFWPHKNHERLLTAFQGYCAQPAMPALKLVLTGVGAPRQDELIQLTQNLGLASQVIFAGYLPRAAFASLLHHCWAVIYPSLFEGFGVPVLEAMHVGKPILGSRIAALQEVADGAMLEFDPFNATEIRNAIINLQTDPQLARLLVERGRVRVQAFDDPIPAYMRVFRQTFACPSAHF